MPTALTTPTALTSSLATHPTHSGFAFLSEPLGPGRASAQAKSAGNARLPSSRTPTLLPLRPRPPSHLRRGMFSDNRILSARSAPSPGLWSRPPDPSAAES